MGRKSILEKKMTSGRVLQCLCDRPDSKAKLVISRRHLDLLFKSRNSQRKKEYRQNVDNIMKYLVRDSSDLVEVKQKLWDTRERLEHESERRAAIEDQNLELQRKVAELEQLRLQLQKERAMRIKSEEDYGKLLATCSENLNSLNNENKV